MKSWYFLSLLVSPAVLANNNQHAIGVDYTYADIENALTTESGGFEELSTSHISVMYQYDYSQYLSLGVGYLKGDSGDVTLDIFDAFADYSVQYQAPHVFAAVNFPLTDNSAFYLKISALKYDYDMLNGDTKFFDESGNDVAYSVGWKHQFSSGLGINTGYGITNLGKHVEITGFHIGIGYHF